MPLLFDEIPRSYLGPSSQAESHFYFYNRSALPASGRLRDMLQRWVDRLPESKQKDIVNRIRHTGMGSRQNDRSFDSAFFELALHEFLRGTRAEVEVEPNVAGRTPDFYAAGANETGFIREYYVEALDVSTADNTELEVSWIEKSCEDALNEIESPDFYLQVETSGALESMPRKKDLKAPFERLLGEVDYDAVWAQYEDGVNWHDLPGATFQHGNWELTGQLLPVSPDRRPKNSGSRFVGVGFFGAAGMLDDIGKPKDRLYEKAKRYKDIPNLIIAVRADDWGIRMDEVLFGTQTYTVYVNQDPRDTSPVPEPRSSRARDGFWCNSTGPQNQHIIGVLQFNTLYPHCVHKAQATFFANPYVDASLPSWTKAIRHAEYEDGQIAMVDGVPPSAYMEDYVAIDDLFEGTPLSRAANNP
ncbi:MAG: hypothetical protein OXE87_00610 [Chloroflexi bacterium]|nr:hypothetical protein [Chloroflexota bacterium]